MRQRERSRVKLLEVLEGETEEEGEIEGVRVSRGGESKGVLEGETEKG